MSKLPVLQKGDIIDIIAPASKPTHIIFKNAVEWVKAQGYIPRYHKDIIKGNTFFASKEEVQWQELKKALMAKDSRAIWCLRGGWGSMRFIPGLARLKKPAEEKLFVGFSDITTLHLFLNQEWGWRTIHGSNLSAFGSAPTQTHQKLYLDLITGKVDTLVYNSLKPMGKVSGIIKGKLTGGNLCMLASTLGTKAQPNLNGKIVFLEEIGERGYRVDRMLEQLVQSGVFNNRLKAIVLGDFTEATELNGRDYTNQAFERLGERLKVPIFKGLRSGHGKINRPLIFNTMATLDTRKKSLSLKLS